jgi:hypothetical protein
MKKCTKCNSEYPATNEYFNKDVSKKDNLHSHCRVCSKKNKSEYYSLNKELLLKKMSEYQKNEGKEKAIVRKRKYAQSERGKQFQREYKIKNRKILNQKERERIANNPLAAQKRIESQRIYAIKNRERLNKENAKRLSEFRKSLITNEEKRLIIKKRDAGYKKRTYNKYKNDPYWKLVHYSRVRMNSIISKDAKHFKIKDMVLYSKEDFVSHIELLFDEKMNWGNYGKKGWHIDHIKPISSFNLNNIEECIECWSLKNLQPLWWIDNLIKGSKLDFNK